MQELILFLISFFIILIGYELFIVLPMKKYRKKKSLKKKDRKEKDDPVEIRFLVYKYGLDLSKVNYNRLLQVVCFTSSLDMAIIVSIIIIVDGYLYQLLLALVLVIPIVFISYGLVAWFYKKKGMIKK